MYLSRDLSAAQTNYKE